MLKAIDFLRKKSENLSLPPFLSLVGGDYFILGQVEKKIKEGFEWRQNASRGTCHVVNFQAGQDDFNRFFETLDSYGSLFAQGESSGTLFFCHQMEKLPQPHWEILDRYLDHPHPDHCVVLQFGKVDKRKSWSKWTTLGLLVESSSPKPRELAVWHKYFEYLHQVQIDPLTWNLILEESHHELALVDCEVSKYKTCIYPETKLSSKLVSAFGRSGGEVDIFEFVEDIVKKHKQESLSKYDKLIRAGENDIKLLSLLLRQFKMLYHFGLRQEMPLEDPKGLASEIGVPFFVLSKLKNQLQYHNRDSLVESLRLIEQCDRQMKIGEGSLFSDFLCPYFERQASA